MDDGDMCVFMATDDGGGTGGAIGGGIGADGCAWECGGCAYCDVGGGIAPVTLLRPP
jgi:hypothetical protein